MNDEQRVKFEAFLIEHDSEIGHVRYHKYHPMYPDQYFDYNAHIAWLAWQAAKQVKELDFTDATVEGWAIGGWAKSKCYRAKSSIGTYNVYDVEGQNGRYCFYSFDYESSDNYQTLDEAIEAANADFRKRVLSCLVSAD